jgi:hypothetical protein
MQYSQTGKQKMCLTSFEEETPILKIERETDSFELYSG